ncbi:MAG: type II toxin-antitoxin system VapC family toxin [Deltaproteobacteria bacterium]|nr:type II toxin-antitoxin system VapC family toxin [Deltaproteobacteria bacterium]
MDWVLDASIALAWSLPDENSDCSDRFFEEVQDGVLWVPALWWYEISNGLTVAQSRKRLAQADISRFIELYAAVPICTDVDLEPDLVWHFSMLAKDYSISAYDAAYLELALRKGIGLATVDRKLATAARRAGVKVFE